MFRKAMLIPLFLCLTAVSSQASSDLSQSLAARMQYAIAFNDPGKLKSLLAAGANPNFPYRDGETPLIAAAQSNSVACAEVLLRSGAQVNARDNLGRTPLIIAAALPLHVGRMLTLLLQHGAQINAQDLSGRNALMEAEDWGYSDTVKILLADHPNLDLQDQQGTTILIQAANDGLLPLVQRLVHDGAKRDIKNLQGETALDLARKNGFAQVAVAIQSPAGQNSKIVNVGNRTGGVEFAANVRFEDAIYRKDFGRVKALLKSGAGVNTRFRDGGTPLINAAANDDAPMVRLLLSRGADVNQRNNIGQTPLMYLATNPYQISPAVLDLLLSHGADINAKDANGRTVLMLENNINGIQVKGWLPYTPVMIKLLHCHPDLNRQDNDGNTLLMFAAIGGDTWLARQLLADGARTDIKNKAGQTAANLATANGYADIAALINSSKRAGSPPE